MFYQFLPVFNIKNLYIFGQLTVLSIIPKSMLQNDCMSWNTVQGRRFLDGVVALAPGGPASPFSGQLLLLLVLLLLSVTLNPKP
jgi:hypothetical protein